MLTHSDRTTVAYVLGVMDQPGLAQGYPDLVRMMDRLFQDRVAKIPWVPPSWLTAVRELQAKHPQDLIKIAPALSNAGDRQEGAPSWADTPEKLKTWYELYQAQQSAIVSYAAKQVEIGRKKLDALYADAAFWDGAYKLAVTVRNLPSNVIKAVGGGVSDFVGTFLPDVLKGYAKLVTGALVLLVVGGVVLWYKGKLGKLAAAAGIKRGKA